MKKLFIALALLTSAAQVHAADYVEITVVKRNWNEACSQARFRALQAACKSCQAKGQSAQVIKESSCSGSDGAYSVGVQFDCY